LHQYIIKLSANSEKIGRRRRKKDMSSSKVKIQLQILGLVFQVQVNKRVKKESRAVPITGCEGL
jgi:hypothetical protein